MYAVFINIHKPCMMQKAGRYIDICIYKFLCVLYRVSYILIKWKTRMRGCGFLHTLCICIKCAWVCVDAKILECVSHNVIATNGGYKFATSFFSTGSKKRAFSEPLISRLIRRKREASGLRFDRMEIESVGGNFIISLSRNYGIAAKRVCSKKIFFMEILMSYKKL